MSYFLLLLACLAGIVIGVNFRFNVLKKYYFLVFSLKKIIKVFRRFYVFIKIKYFDKQFTTEGGNIVKSGGEQQIANFLFEQKINYEYEKPILLRNGRVIYPDFYLLDYDTYIEYFGRLGDEKYNHGIAWKRNFYKRNSIKCIKLYPNNIANLKVVLTKRFEKVTEKVFPQRKYFNYANQRGTIDRVKKVFHQDKKEAYYSKNKESSIPHTVKI